MPDATDFPARGRIKQINGNTVVFCPSGTNYELHLTSARDPAELGGLDRPVEVLIRVSARKIWTVPSGGNFIAPIFGSPRIIQGRVKWLDSSTLVVHAGTNFVVMMPGGSEVIDLAEGPIEQGVMVNVTAFAGATIEVPAPSAAAHAG